MRSGRLICIDPCYVRLSRCCCMLAISIAWDLNLLTDRHSATDDSHPHTSQTIALQN